MNIINRSFAVKFLLFGLFVFQIAAYASDFRGEIMAVQGETFIIPSGLSRASLQKGQLVSVGDSLETGSSSFIDVGFDRDWKNVTRVGENSTVKISDLYPTNLTLVSGEVLAKLDALPKDSTFEIKTPTAVIGIRGSACWVKFEAGVTVVTNPHPHAIYVGPPAVGASLDPNKVQLVNQNQKATIGPDLKVLVENMSAAEIAKQADAFATLTAEITQRNSEGPSSQLSDIAKITQTYQADLAERVSSSGSTDTNAPSEANSSTSFDTSVAVSNEDQTAPPHEDQRAGNPSSGNSSGGNSGGSGDGGLNTSVATDSQAV